MDFLEALARHGFLQQALIAGLLASVAAGVVGTWVVVRRITYIAGGIAHCVFGGLGVARYLEVVHGVAYASPLVGAAVAALLAAAVIGATSLVAREREDTAIGATWAVGMAIGVLFLSRTPGYNQDLMSYLFGNILLTTKLDLWLLVVLDVALVVGTSVLYRPMMALSFEEEFARVRSVRVEWLYLLLLATTALAIVLLVRIVGIVMVIALLTLPVAIAGRFSRTLVQMMVGATVLSAIFTISGLALSYGPDLPAGATTILVAGVAYFVVSFTKRRA